MRLDKCYMQYGRILLRAQLKKSLISLMHIYVQYFHVNNLHSDKAQA